MVVIIRLILKFNLTQQGTNKILDLKKLFMNYVFPIRKIYFVYLIVSFLIPSCNNSSSTDGDGKDSDSAQLQPVPGAILITDVDASGNLVLKDIHGNSMNTRPAHRNEVINWIVQTSKVDGITGLALDTHVTPNENVFSELPHQQGNPKHWKGTIGNPPNNGQIIEEKYFIQWLPQNSSTPKTFDPKIQLNPTFIPPDSLENNGQQ
jgi:hypothetical protein